MIHLHIGSHCIYSYIVRVHNFTTIFVCEKYRNTIISARETGCFSPTSLQAYLAVDA